MKKALVLSALLTLPGLASAGDILRCEILGPTLQEVASLTVELTAENSTRSIELLSKNGVMKLEFVADELGAGLYSKVGLSKVDEESVGMVYSFPKLKKNQQTSFYAGSYLIGCDIR